MHSSLLILAAVGGLFVRGSSAIFNFFPDAKNFIYIVPDGFGPASQTLARDYVSLLQHGEDPKNHVSIELPADKLVIGNVRTFSGDNLITDSAASATAFACGVKTQNGVIGLDKTGQPVGSILEAAHLAGMKTGLVVTSTITHATPAGYVAHIASRGAEDKIAEQELGYSHPLGSVVDILMGGGRCYFVPKQAEGSCRNDDLDLLKWAKQKGWSVITDRAGFDNLRKGSKATLPYIGLFNDGMMQYELDRDPAKEPSLVEMVETALNSLKKATRFSPRGYFLMIEASRIDHAGHANDAAGHLHDIIQYNEVVDFVRKWIDKNPDTLMLSAADHETGGLTLDGYNPLPLKGAKNTTEVLAPLFADYDGDDAAGLLRDTILPAYGITDASDKEIESLIALKGKSSFANALGNILADRAGISWTTGGHSAIDVTLLGYGWRHKGEELKREMAGNWDNTELPKYIEGALKVSLDKATKALRKGGSDWVPRSISEKRSEDYHHLH
ncbi:hypothetical protein VTO42DRAFT_729 [Malbranchea cinnamomea]